MSDTINRVPPPVPPRDPLRSVAPAGAPVVRREDQQPQQKKKDQPDDQHDEPQDTVELSVPVEEIHDDGKDRFWMTWQAAHDLLHQHQHVYPPIEFQQLLGHLIHLQKEKIERIYWPPTMTFADALAHAAMPDHIDDEPPENL